jgi:glycerophosphoryl diester phosphodiesterase
MQPQLHIVTPAQRADAKVRSGGHLISVVAHAGLGISRPGGAPNRTTLQRASRAGVDAVELDLCTTADQALVLHHDLRTPRGMPLSALTLPEIRRRGGSPLTLDDGIEQLSSGQRIVLDLKTSDAVMPIARWLVQRPDASRFVVCTERVDALRALSLRAPSAQIWQTFPNIGRGTHERVAHMFASLFAERGRRAAGLAGDLAGVIGRMRLQPNVSLTRLAGVPWRRLLPRLMGAVRDDLGACGIAVHHALVTPELCEAAHTQGMTVTAWTVNEPDVARRVAATGVDMITTDRVNAIRRAVPTRPHVLTGGRNRVAG